MHAFRGGIYADKHVAILVVDMTVVAFEADPP